MQVLGLLGGLASVVFMVWCILGVLFAKGLRRRRMKMAGLGFLGLIGSMVLLVIGADQVAREAGFADNADQSRAKNAGVTDPAIWQERRQDEIRIADEKAARDKVNAEQLAREKADQAKADAERLKQDEEKAAAAKLQAENEKQAACRNDLRCWAEAAFVSASIDCANAIQSLAKWDYEWTDGWSEPKLARFRWKDQAAGIVTYTGDKLKLQNGFGAWKHVTYSCDYDPATKRVVSAQAF
jgi:hypothetical protein